MRQMFCWLLGATGLTAFSGTFPVGVLVFLWVLFLVMSILQTAARGDRGHESQLINIQNEGENVYLESRAGNT